MAYDDQKILEAWTKIIADAKNGDKDAFATIYREFAPSLRRFFEFRVLSEAEELTSETWLGIAQSLNRFEGNINELRSWIYRIAHNKLVDWIRKHKSQVKIAELVEGRADVNISSVDVNPEDYFVEAVSTAQLYKIISEVLTDTETECVTLRIFGGLNVNEIAKIMDKRVGAIRAIQFRAFGKLGAALKNNAESEN